MNMGEVAICLNNAFFFTSFFFPAFCRRPKAAGVWRQQQQPRPETMKKRRFQTAITEALTPVPKGRQRQPPESAKNKEKEKRGGGRESYCLQVDSM